MIKGIFWDNDGVLVDTEPLYFRAMRETLQEVGIELDLTEYTRITLDQGRSSLCLAEQRGFSATEVERLRHAKNVRYAALLAEGIRPRPGATEAVRALRGRARMAIVTSSRRDHFDLIHQHTGLPAYFDFILTREDFHLTKPHPEPYLKALKRSGLQPEECLVIEDTRRGLDAALNAGLRCLVIPSRLTPDSSFAGAWRVMHDLTDVTRLLLENTAARGDAGLMRSEQPGPQ